MIQKYGKLKRKVKCAIYVRFRPLQKPHTYITLNVNKFSVYLYHICSCWIYLLLLDIRKKDIKLRTKTYIKTNFIYNIMARQKYFSTRFEKIISFKDEMILQKLKDNWLMYDMFLFSFLRELKTLVSCCILCKVYFSQKHTFWFLQYNLIR